MEFRGFRGFQEDRTDHTVLLAKFQPIWWCMGQKVHFSTFDGKLTFQCSRNGPQNSHFVQGLSRTPLLFIPRYLTNIFSRIFKKQISRIDNLKIWNFKNPGSLTGAQQWFFRIISLLFMIIHNMLMVFHCMLMVLSLLLLAFINKTINPFILSLMN